MCPLISTYSEIGFATNPSVKWTKGWIVSRISLYSDSLLEHYCSFAACLWLVHWETRRFEDCRKLKGKRVRVEGIERDLKIRIKRGRAHTLIRMPPMVRSFFITRLSTDTDANNFRHLHLETDDSAQLPPPWCTGYFLSAILHLSVFETDMFILLLAHSFR